MRRILAFAPHGPIGTGSDNDGKGETVMQDLHAVVLAGIALGWWLAAALRGAV